MEDFDKTVTLPRKRYLAIKGIKGNYAPTDKVEIPVIRGKYGWIEHTGETTLVSAQEKAHKADATQEDTHDESDAIADLIANN